MDNFDLKKYLSNNPLTENLDVYNVHKITLKDTGETYYTKSIKSQAPTAEKWFNKFYKATLANDKRGVSQGEIGRLMATNPDIESWDLTTIKRDLPNDEAVKLRDTLRSKDSNSIASKGGADARSGVDSTKIKVPKDKSISLGGKVYVDALYLQRNSDFKKRVSKLLDKIPQNIPGKGSYFKINSNNVERI